MADVELGYGNDSLSFSFDDSRFQVLTPDITSEKPLTDVEIGNALGDPIESLPLDELITSGDSVLIVVSDATRATASAQVVNLLVRRLIECGVAPSDLAIIFATGIHRKVTPEEKVELLTPFIAQRVRTLDHEADNTSEMESFGTTASGTPVELNRALKNFSRTIITSGIGFHYFAGFTGGRKSICPGLASSRTIEATHKLAFDFENGGRRAGVGTGLLRGNAVHEECERIAALVAPDFSVNSIVDSRGRALKVFAGNWKSAHALGCREYLGHHATEIAKKRELVVVSCGGLPYDINLIQAHKALEMAAHACADGGTIILIAECRDGFGRPDFLKWFEEKDSRALEARLRTDYEVNGQTAWALLSKTERFRVHLISNLPDSDVRKMRMHEARSVDAVLKSVKNDVRGYLMPHGTMLLPQVVSSFIDREPARD